jgi:hypothetical protein
VEDKELEAAFANMFLDVHSNPVDWVVLGTCNNLGTWTWTWFVITLNLILIWLSWDVLFFPI